MGGGTKMEKKKNWEVQKKRPGFCPGRRKKRELLKPPEERIPPFLGKPEEASEKISSA